MRSRNEYGFSAYSDILYFRTFDFAHQKQKDEIQNTLVKSNNFYDNIFPDTSTENHSYKSDLEGFTKDAELSNIPRFTASRIEEDANSVVRKPLATRRSQGIFSKHNVIQRCNFNIIYQLITKINVLLLL